MPKVKLYLGDCLDIMELIPDNSIDMVLCDLPYGTTKCSWDVILPFNDYIEVQTSSKKIKKMEFNEYLSYGILKGLSPEEIQDNFRHYSKKGLWTHYSRIVKENGAICLFGQEPFSSLLRNSNLADYRYDIYWEKERPTNVYQIKKRVGKTVETISVFYKKQCTYNPQMKEYDGPLRRNTVKNGKLGKLTDHKENKVIPYVDNGTRYPTQVWQCSREFLKEKHFETQKPLLLCEEIIKTFSNEGDTVLDNTMGSGTTGLACLNTNRGFIGIEKMPENYKIATARLNYTCNVCLDSNTFVA